MQPQVNLLSTLPIEKKEWLTVPFIVKACAGLFVFLLLLTAHDLWQGSQQEDSLDDLQIEEVALEKNYLNLKSEHAKIANQDVLKTEVGLLREQLLKKQKLHGKLSNIKNNNLRGFSRYLAELAKISVSGLWLDKIFLEDGGAIVSLSGKTWSSRLVPIYLSRLNQTKLFSPLNLRIAKIKRDTKDPKLLLFTLSNKVEDEE